MAEKEVVETSEAQIAVHWQEEGLYYPSSDFIAQANMTDAAVFDRFSLDNFPNCFKEYADLLREADHIFIEELRNHDLYEKVSQAFAVFLPVRSVGVMGDGRRYDYVIALRAVETVDFMTAHWAHLPYEFLDLVSRRIINEIAGISRVTYDISGKPPATIEWE